MKKINIIITIALCFIFGACSNDDNFFDESAKSEITPGTYYADLLLATEASGNVNSITRGGPTNLGMFTDVYPYNYIYLHRADDLSLEEGHQSIKIPLKEVTYCDDCRGIHLEVTIKDNGEGYTVATEDGQTLTLADDDKVYFSTIEDTYWQPTILEEGGSPVSGKDVFMQDSEVNKELLRSVNDYSKEELVALLQNTTPEIEMERHCTAFKVFFMFTNIMPGYVSTIDRDTWISTLGEDFAPENFYIKLYLGPNFTSNYNVFSDNTDKDKDGGFYVTNQEKYTSFEYTFYTSMGGGEEGYVPYSYYGYGYNTDADYHLIAPLNMNIPVDDFCVYAFVKYTPDITKEDPDFLTSDEGAKWFPIQIPRMTLQTNTVHWIALAFDISNLEEFKTDANNVSRLTRILTGPERMELKYPYKVINIEE